MFSHLREKVPHGTGLFPFQVYETPSLTGTFAVPLHWHPELEIIRVFEGNVKIEVDGTVYQVQKDEVVFLNSGSLHIIEGNGTECKYNALVFPMRALLLEHFDICQDEYLLPLNTGQLIFPTHLARNMDGANECSNTIASIFSIFEKSPIGYELCFRGLIMQLLGYLVANQLLIKKTNDEKTVQQDLQRSILNYINENSHRSISLEEIAKIFNFSPKYFCRYFKLQFGRSFIDYVTQVRMQKAAYLLANTNEKIMAISMDCGYDNLSYFTRRFKLYHMHSPQSYRKLVRFGETLVP